VTTFDQYLAERMKDPAFASAFSAGYEAQTKARIIRLAPQHPILTWSVGHGEDRSIFCMMMPKAQLRAAVKALEAFVLDKRKNLKPFLA